jgi:hypothetical protein
VTYRVKRAEELLGRRVTDEPIELTCALTLAAVLGSAVLAADEDDGAPALSESATRGRGALRRSLRMADEPRRRP